MFRNELAETLSERRELELHYQPIVDLGSGRVTSCETLLLKDDVRTLEVLKAIGDMGVSIALDDFGTGYASLSHLRSFPFDKLKIDQTFVRDIELREDSVAIVRAITTLTRSLGMRTVAEGVETVDPLEKAAGAGCDEAQGYLFSRPVPAGDIAGVIEARGRAASRAARAGCDRRRVERAILRRASAKMLSGQHITPRELCPWTAWNGSEPCL